MTTKASPVKTATAWQYSRRGKLPETLLKSEVAIPDLKPGEVLIKVHAAALNPVDWKLAALIPTIVTKKPQTAASDFSGEVVAFCHAAAEKEKAEEQKLAWLQEGARVYGIIPGDERVWSGLGSLSTYLIVRTSLLGPIPEGMKFTESAGLSLTGLTATTMVTKVKIKKGDRILVLGGTTSVGLLLLQMCKAEGASLIVATCSNDKASAVKQCGAHEIVDYRSQDVEKTLKDKYSSEPFDAVLDCVGSFDTYRACADFLKSDGVFLNIGASELDPSRMLRSGVELIRNVVATSLRPAFLGGVPRKYILAGTDVRTMPKFREYIATGAVKPWVDSVFPFDQAPKAYEHLIKGRALGKVVVSVIDE